MAPQKKSALFLLGWRHTLGVALYCFGCLFILSQFLFSEGKFVTPVSGAHIQAQLFIGWLIILVSSSIVCLPLLRMFYSCLVEGDRIHGLSSPVPFVGVRRSCQWEKIYRVEYRSFAIFSFYAFFNSKGQLLLWAPCDLEDIEKFKKSVATCAGEEHPFTRLLKGEKRSSPLSLSPNIIHNQGAFLFRGRVLRPDKVKPLSWAKVNLYKEGRLLDKAIANENGYFFFDVTSEKGLHTLVLDSDSFKAKLPISLPKDHKLDIEIHALPKARKKIA